MLKEPKNFAVFLFFGFIVFSGMGTCQSSAQGIAAFGPQETRIEGSIPYSVIGKYKAQFRSFKGRVIFDGRLHQIQSVYLKIEVKSIISNCPWCDKIARSRRLLNAVRYPYIIFKSDKIIHDENGFKVRGVLAMHGVSKAMSFPFNVRIIDGRNSRIKLLVLHGSWVINRKDFNIIWNKYLDHGGILVGDNFTVNWGIEVYIK